MCIRDSSTTIVLLAGMMVIGSSLFHAGITDLIGEKMVRVTGKSERNIILATLIVSCALSSVCSNIGVMTAMAPLVTAMCIAAGVGPSKALLSLLFGAQFGGFVTLVGVGSNLSLIHILMTFGTGDTGGSLYPAGAALSQLWTNSVQGVKCNTQTSTGSFQNVQDVASGEVDVDVYKRQDLLHIVMPINVPFRLLCIEFGIELLTFDLFLCLHQIEVDGEEHDDAQCIQIKGDVYKRQPMLTKERDIFR